MSSDNGASSAQSLRIGPRELAGWLAAMVGAAFVPGLAIGVCAVVILAIAHLVG